MHDKVLYYGEWDAGIPFSVSLTGIRDRSVLDAIEGIVTEASSFVGGFTDDDSGQAPERRKNITKAVQSFRALIVEFLPQKIPIGLRSGGDLPPVVVPVFMRELGS